MKQTSFLKKYWKYILTFFIGMIIGSGMGPTQEELDAEKNKLKDEKEIIETLKADIDKKDKNIAQLETEVTTLNNKVDEAKPWFEMKEEEKQRQAAQTKAAEEKRLAEEKAKAEAEEKAKAQAEAKAKAEAEEKEKIGYNTGITYNQLARTPDNYIGQKVKFKGKVVQVMEGDGEVQIRLAVNDDYDTVLYGVYLSSVTNSRILEDDIITVYGLSSGLISYQSTIGGKISIPGVLIQKIEQNS